MSFYFYAAFVSAVYLFELLEENVLRYKYLRPKIPDFAGAFSGPMIFRDNGKRTEFAECTLSNGIATFKRKHHFVHQNRPNSPIFCPARLYLFQISTTTIARTNKH